MLEAATEAATEAVSSASDSRLTLADIEEIAKLMRDKGITKLNFDGAGNLTLIEISVSR